MDRLEKLRKNVDLETMRGLEIGPLVSPIVTPDLGTIYYVDHASTEDLRIKYDSDPAVDVRKLVDVDFVWGEKTLLEAAGTAAPFDYVVASHVIEHVPDIIGWLHEVSEVLAPGGRLCLAVPDRRLTFDVRRRPSDLSEAVEAHLLRLRRPPVRATFEHFAKFVEVDTNALWYGRQGFAPDAPLDYRAATELATRSAQFGEYVDTHCWVFSDAEFVSLLTELMRMQMLDFRFAGFIPPELGEFEFFAVLERLDPTTSPQARTEAGLASVPTEDQFATVPVESAGVAYVDPRPDGLLSISDKEARLIERKRALLGTARRIKGSLTARLRR